MCCDHLRSATSSWTCSSSRNDGPPTPEVEKVTEKRTEKQVLEELSDEQRALLKRVLEIERAKLHITAYDATDDLIAAVKEIIP